MYNRYLAAAEQTAPETSEPPQSSTFSGLGRTLNARLQGVRLDMDTMIALLIVWFLLMDDDGVVDWEQFLLTAALLLTLSIPAFATSGDVAGAVEQTWTSAQGQIKTVVNNVVFPVLDVILAVLFFVKVGASYFDYRKHGQFEFAGPAILFACLLFTLTAPLYIWGVVGM